MLRPDQVRRATWRLERIARVSRARARAAYDADAAARARLVAAVGLAENAYASLPPDATYPRMYRAAADVDAAKTRLREGLIEQAMMGEAEAEKLHGDLDADLREGLIGPSVYEDLSARIEDARERTMVKYGLTMQYVDGTGPYVAALARQLGREASFCFSGYAVIGLECRAPAIGRDCVTVRKRTRLGALPCRKRFQFIDLLITWYHAGEGIGGHANAVIIDHERKTIELFEPHGGAGTDWDGPVSEFLRTTLARLLGLAGYALLVPVDYCPHLGPQALLSKDILAGSCAIWSFWFIEQRILHPNKSAAEIMRGIATMTPHEAHEMLVALSSYMMSLDVGAGPIMNPEMQARLWHHRRPHHEAELAPRRPRRLEEYE